MAIGLRMGVGEEPEGLLYQLPSLPSAAFRVAFENLSIDGALTGAGRILRIDPLRNVT